MSALGLASLGVQCQNKALGMASLGAQCVFLTTLLGGPRDYAYDDRDEEDLITILSVLVMTKRI